jgi:hypothetical protein
MKPKTKTHSKILYGVEVKNSPLVIESEVSFSDNHKASQTWFHAMSELITPQAGLELPPHPREMTRKHLNFPENDQRRKSCKRTR